MGYESFALVVQSSVPPVNFEICQKAFNKLNSIGTLARMLLATGCSLLSELAPFGCKAGRQINMAHGRQPDYISHFIWVESVRRAHIPHTHTYRHTQSVVERQGPGPCAQTGRTKVIIKLVIIKAATQSEVLDSSRQESDGEWGWGDWGDWRLKTGETTAAPIKFSSAVF